MSASSRRHFIVARLAVYGCAIVGMHACGDSHSVDAEAPASVMANRNEAPTATATTATATATSTSELEDWAKQATSPSSVPVHPAQADIARASSDALATPVIHTVD